MDRKGLTLMPLMEKYMKKLLIMTLLSLTSSAEVLKADVKFEAVGKPAFIRIKGSSTQLEEKLSIKNNKISGEVLFDLTSMTTGLDLRDDHMKNKYLEVSKYPKARLTLKEIPLEGDLEHRALLSLHGMEKEVLLKGEIEKRGTVYIVNGKFELDISEYGIDIPSFKGITVAKEVKVKVEAEVKL